MIRGIIIKLLKSRIADTKNFEDMPTDIFLSYLYERFVMLVRGILLFGNICFVGKGVRLKCKKRMRIGKFVTIHDYSCLDACSEEGLIIEDYCTIGRNSLVRVGNIASYDGFFIMRKSSSCNANCFIGATGGIEIGEHVLMGPNVTILSEEHNYERIDISIKEQGIKNLPVIISDDVWIGANAVILGGISVGKAAIIGAGSIVTKPVNDYEIVVGNPAKPIKTRQIDGVI